MGSNHWFPMKKRTNKRDENLGSMAGESSMTNKWMIQEIPPSFKKPEKRMGQNWLSKKKDDSH
jgi:hypothetical protein